MTDTAITIGLVEAYLGKRRLSRRAKPSEVLAHYESQERFVCGKLDRYKVPGRITERKIVYQTFLAALGKLSEIGDKEEEGRYVACEVFENEQNVAPGFSRTEQIEAAVYRLFFSQMLRYVVEEKKNAE